MPPAVAEVGTEILTDVIKQAVEKQMQIIAEAQAKAEAFVGKKVSSNKAMGVFYSHGHVFNTYVSTIGLKNAFR